MKTLNQKIYKNLKFFFSFFRPNLKFIIILAIGVFLGVILQLPMPLITRYVVDKVLPQKSIVILNWIVVGLIFLMILKLAIGLLTSYISNLMKERILNSFQLSIFEHLINIEYFYFKQHKSGYLAARMENDVNQLRGLLVNNFINILNSLLTFVVGVFMIFSFHWKLAFLSLSILPFFVISLKYFSLKIRFWAAEVQEKYAHIYDFFQESISAISIVKSFQLEKKEVQRLAQKQNDRMQVNIKAGLVSSIASSVTGFIGGVGPILILWYGGHEIINGNWTLGSFIAFNTFLTYLFGPARQFTQINEQIQESLASLIRLSEFLELPIEKEKKGIILDPNLVKGQVEFNNVDFSYENSLKVLKGITFKINSFEKVAIVGKSGVGKTTLVNLLTGFISPQGGEILIDNISLRQIDIGSIRSIIGIASQDCFLFSDTIYENIRCGNLNSKPEDIFEAARLAHVDEFVNRFPNGYNTIVGERGTKLSGGQRQRIALARLVLRNSKILILDEPTSELDSNSAEYIRETIDTIGKNKTIFIISHQFSNIIHVNQIIFLKDGEILEQGTHEDLYKKCVEYQNFFDVTKNSVKK